MSDEKLVGAVVRAIERLMERVEGLPDLSEDFADARDATKRIASHLFQNKRVGESDVTASPICSRGIVTIDQPDHLRVIYERDPDFKGGSWWSASSPDLPALTTQGDGFPGVRKRVREALSTIWDDVGRANRAVLEESALRPLDYETITTIQGEALSMALGATEDKLERAKSLAERRQALIDHDNKVRRALLSERDAWRDQFREAEEAAATSESRFLEMEQDASRTRAERNAAMERVDELVKALAKRDAEFVGACMDRDRAQYTAQRLRDMLAKREITEHEFAEVCAARDQALTAVQLLEGKVETALAALATAKHGVLHQHERAETAEGRLKHAKEARANAETAASSWRDAHDQMRDNRNEEQVRAIKAEDELKTVSEATNLLIAVAVNSAERHAKVARGLTAAKASLRANLEAMGKKLEEANAKLGSGIFLTLQQTMALKAWAEDLDDGTPKGGWGTILNNAWHAARSIR
jgi:predicted RNase H-like HicB family nuclease